MQPASEQTEIGDVVLHAVHPFRAILPQVTGPDRAAFFAYVEAHGLIDNVVTIYKGMLLHGLLRRDAAYAAGIPLRYEEFKGDDAAALDFLIGSNVQRAHYTPGQKAMTGAMYMAMPESRKTFSSDGRFVDYAANLCGASAPYIFKARHILAKAAPQIAQAVLAGTLNIPQAEKLLELSAYEQKSVLDLKARHANLSMRKLINKVKPARKQIAKHQPAVAATVHPKCVGCGHTDDAHRTAGATSGKCTMTYTVVVECGCAGYIEGHSVPPTVAIIEDEKAAEELLEEKIDEYEAATPTVPRHARTFRRAVFDMPLPMQQGPSNGKLRNRTNPTLLASAHLHKGDLTAR